MDREAQRVRVTQRGSQIFTSAVHRFVCRHQLHECIALGIDMRSFLTNHFLQPGLNVPRISRNIFLTVGGTLSRSIVDWREHHGVAAFQDIIDSWLHGDAGPAGLELMRSALHDIPSDVLLEAIDPPRAHDLCALIEAPIGLHSRSCHLHLATLAHLVHGSDSAWFSGVCRLVYRWARMSSLCTCDEQSQPWERDFASSHPPSDPSHGSGPPDSPDRSRGSSELRRSARRAGGASRDSGQPCQGFRHHAVCLAAGSEVHCVQDQATNTFRFVADTGATVHLVSSPTLAAQLVNVEPADIVVYMNQHPSAATLRGGLNATFCSPDGTVDTTPLYIFPVLYVPGGHHNLLSISSLLAQHGGSVTCSHSTCTISPTNRAAYHGVRKNNLYEFSVLVSLSPPSAASAQVIRHRQTLQLRLDAPPTPALLELHSRLGHRGLGTLQQMVRSGAISTTHEIRRDLLASRDLRCPHCARARSIRRSPSSAIPFGPTAPQAGLWSLDVAGPYVASVGGAIYALLVVCHSSRYLFFQPTKGKSAPELILQRHLPAWEREAGSKCTTMRTDRAGEFIAPAFQRFLSERGVVHQATAPDSSFQNGVTERRIRSLRESTAASLSESGLPTPYWAEAFAYNTYIMNRMNSVSCGNVSPYYLATNTAPPLGHIHSFGCLSYAHLPKELQVKRDHAGRARPCLLLGFCTDSKDAYRLLNLATQRVIRSRSVTFLDSVFPGPVPTASLSRSHGESVTSAPQIVSEAPSLPQRSQRPRIQRELFDPSSLEAARQHDQDAIRVSAAASSSAEPSVPAMANVVAFNEPNTIRQAMTSLDAPRWREAVASELESHRINATWQLSELPPGRVPIHSRWVFKVKVGKDGLPSRWKARLVALGFQQRANVDYVWDELFSPTLRWQSFRLLCAIAVQHGLHLHLLDVATAFLVPTLNEQIYMTLPQGTPYDLPAGHVLLLKQSPTRWSEEMNSTLRHLGFTASDADPCLYTRLDVHGNVEAVLALFVDDVALACKTIDQMTKLKDSLKARYSMTDAGPMDWFLGVRVDYDIKAGCLALSQAAYATDILRRFNMEECRTVSVPMEARLQVVEGDVDKEELQFMLDKKYSALVGALLYLANCTRPDVAYAVNQLARFMSNPRRVHWLAAQRVLRYVRGTVNYELRYIREEEKFTLQGFSDSDWGGDTATRRSTTGYVFIGAYAAISWKSMLQKTVAISTCEAEIMALALCVSEAIWLKRLLAGIVPSTTNSTMTIHEDNQGAIALVKDHKFSNKTKHVDIKYFFVREQVQAGELLIIYCETANMVADIFTKPLAWVAFSRLRSLLGVHQSPNTDNVSSTAGVKEESKSQGGVPPS
jgi:transposase InsO family protein